MAASRQDRASCSWKPDKCIIDCWLQLCDTYYSSQLEDLLQVRPLSTHVMRSLASLWETGCQSWCDALPNCQGWALPAAQDSSSSPRFAGKLGGRLFRAPPAG